MSRKTAQAVLNLEQGETIALKFPDLKSDRRKNGK